jgi:hypothetical protein
MDNIMEFNNFAEAREWLIENLTAPERLALKKIEWKLENNHFEVIPKKEGYVCKTFWTQSLRDKGLIYATHIFQGGCTSTDLKVIK